MNQTNLEVGEMRLALLDGGREAGRAENIARLTLEFVRELMDREWQHSANDAVIDSLQVPPIRVSLATTDDETVARLSAEGIHRALLAAR